MYQWMPRGHEYWKSVHGFRPWPNVIRGIYLKILQNLRVALVRPDFYLAAGAVDGPQKPPSAQQNASKRRAPMAIVGIFTTLWLTPTPCSSMRAASLLPSTSTIPSTERAKFTA